MGRAFKFFAIPASLIALCGTTAVAQSVISAHSGLVHYVEGQVTLDDKVIEVKFSQFPEVRPDQVLKTEDGRAEVLLTPGVFLRLAENSAFRMLSNKLADTRIEGLAGSLILEHGEINKDNQVTLIFKDRTITFLKSGLYRLDADSGSLRVYQGEARIATPEQSIVARQAREVQLEAAVLTAMKFDPKADDDFYRWASRRAGYLSMANVSAAKSMHDSGYSMTSGMWGWNPWYGMFTYIPFNSMYYSPFGYSFYSPYMVSQFYRYGNYNGYYNPGYYSGSSGGGGTVARAARYDSANNYSVPARSASSGSSLSSIGAGSRSNGGGGFSGGAMSAGGGGSSASVAGPSSRGGASGAPAGGGGHAGGGSSAGRGR